MPHRVRCTRPLAAFIALAMLPVGALAAISTAKEPAPDSVCAIKATPQTGMVKLQAFANADPKETGTYTFRIEKSGGGGSSLISQGGDFSAAAGGSQLLSSVMLDAAGSRYKAVLDLTIDGKTFTCTSTGGGY